MTADDIASGLSFNKILFKKYIRDRFNDKAKAISSARYGNLEQQSFEQQKKEAEKYNWRQLSNYTNVNYFSNCLGISVSDLVAKINAKVTAYNSAVATLLGEQKVLEDEVDALDTIAKAHEWRHKKLGIAASVQQTNEDAYSRSTC